MKTILSRLFFLLCLFSAIHVQAEEKEYNSPMGVVIDQETGYYYVSSVNGMSITTKRGGYITRLSPEGFVLQKEFIIGSPEKGFFLTGPKGLAIMKENLYVADIDKVKIFNKFSGDYVGEIGFDYLNSQNIFDIAIDEQHKILYAADPYSNAVYQYDLEGKYPTLVSKTADLGNPSGLAIHPVSGTLYVTSTESGDIISFSRKTGAKKTVVRGLFGSVFGMDFDKDNNLILSSMKTGEIYVLFRDKTFKTLFRNLMGPALLKLDKTSGKIIVPKYEENAVGFLTYQPYGSKERK